MHIIGIPYGQSPNRGLPVQVSMNKALKTMGLDRLPDLPDGGDLNDGSTGTAAASPAQRARVQDRSIERSVGVRER